MKRTQKIVDEKIYRCYRYYIVFNSDFGYIAMCGEHRKPIAIASTIESLIECAKRSIDLYLI